MTVKAFFSDDQLLAKIASGDQRAFALFYDRYADKVFGQSVRLLKDDQLAQEVTQEIFLKIWRLGNQLLELDHPEAYLRTMTRNRCLNELRRIMRDSTRSEAYLQEFQEVEHSTEEAIFLKESKQIVDYAIGLLPVQQQQVYILCYRDGLKYKEAAEKLGISHLAVQSHMKRALQFLRAYLKDHPDLAAVIILLKLF